MINKEALGEHLQQSMHKNFITQQTRKTNKESIATIARKSWQSSNEEDNAPTQISNGTYSSSAIKGVQKD
jgi:hypothetical protein